MLECLKTAHAFSVDELTELSFNKKHPWHQNMVALYVSMIEFTRALVNSFDHNNIISVNPVFRPFFEAYVAFINLSNDKCYGYHMKAADFNGKIKVLKASKTGMNPYLNLKLIGEGPETSKILADHEKKLEALKKKGYPPLNILRKCEIADMENEYRSIYSFMSNHIHNNLNALNSLHVERDTKTEFNVVLYRKWDIEDYKPQIIHATFFLLKAGERLHELLESKSCERFTEKLKELERKYREESSS